MIWLKFASISFEELGVKSPFMQALHQTASDLGIVLPEADLKFTFMSLLKAAAAKSPSGKTVLLIDEYDKPLTDLLERRQLDASVEETAHHLREIQSTTRSLSLFHSVLKDAEPYLALVFITGVSAYSKVSIFSEFNNLGNLTLHPAAKTVTGITSAEVNVYFKVQLKETGVDLAEIRRWYNGYAFSSALERVYNPSSLMSFLSTGELRGYWYETETPAWLLQHMARQGTFNVDGSAATAEDLQSLELQRLDTATILFQTGYLTLAEHNPSLSLYTLAHPNYEVGRAFDEALLGG